ncbi:PH domain-containing protein [Legionella oakridgensis]|uniref:Transmembrane protein n=2 Tax=Legionella oakridgensis TaxID=29423 RepID=A0A0W0XH93_9GAMM|nr:PH domain-containing protein [Legionella oakridgensis]AHE66153.1 putative membrane protein [Legionella oakridgensis ATCC 33761 = DSM 21215]ETO94018.1 putative membrane protein [Legionella oakridgensis RV-2-2007]KTD43896.1 transmembrane protein [Legionella oakridgensis]STY16064.1 transmembrane protein [Legionella longbeachae]
MTNNNIVYQARLHWILFFWPLALLCLAVYAAINYPILYPVPYFLVFIALAWLIMIWVTYQFSSLTIKNKQVILCTGFLVRQTMDIPLSKIESIDIRQSIFGSILRYGSLVITGTGGSRQIITYLNKPLTCRRYIEQLMHE